MIFTRLASLLWSTVNAGVGGAYRRGWFRRERLPIRTVSIGNLQAGGTGKTPVVAWLAREALARGRRPVILTRGYGGAWSQVGGVLAPRAPGVDPAECGDEVALLHRLVPEAWIGVGADRKRAFALVREQGGDPDLAILDDGFQHFRLIREVDLVLLTDAEPGETLFRENFRALKRASLVIWTKGRRVVEMSIPQAEVKLTPPSAEHASRKYWLVSGVGNPDHLEASVRAAGYRIERHVRFPDHARYARPMLDDLAQSAESAGARLLTTGKDWVKWEAQEFTRGEWIEPELQWQTGLTDAERVLWG